MGRPHLWRSQGGPWNPLYKGERRTLQYGDQVSLIAQPEAAALTCAGERIWRAAAPAGHGTCSREHGSQRFYSRRKWARS